MKCKRFISILLLAVYLLAAGQLVWSVMVCHCAVPVPDETEHVCCEHCPHLADVLTTTDGALCASCGCNHHVMTEELYVVSTSDHGERLSRLIGWSLSPALVSETVELVSCRLSAGIFRSAGNEAFVAAPALLGPDFRGPPVLV